MGSKGSQLKEQKNTSYSANPVISGAGQQAIGMASNAANQPFQTPVAPVAPFSNDQRSAFQGVRDAYGMAQPYFNTAAALALQSASPISAGAIGNYLNPFASYALSGLNNTIGSQNTQLRGNLVQAAGGTGADRIGVAQAEKFKQDQLARGQLMSGFYQPALNAAQQDAGRQGAAASLFGYFGPAAQTAGLQSAGSLLNTGGLQQQQQQAELNAPYQNILAQIADPFQKAQFLASITGGLAPAFGGNSESQTYGPKPSVLSQALGLGATALGAYMGMPQLGAAAGSAFGGKGSASGGGYYGGSPESNPMLNPASYGNIRAMGGRVDQTDTLQGFDVGGPIDDDILTRMPDVSFNRPLANKDQSRVPTRPILTPPQTVPDLTNNGPPQTFSPTPNIPQPGRFSFAPEDSRPEPGVPWPVRNQRPPQQPPGGGGVPFDDETLDREGTSSQMAANPWLALAYAGAKTAAGQSPYALANIGEGAAAGIEMLSKQGQAAQQARRVDLEAKRLFEQANQHRESLGEQRRFHDMTASQHRDTLIESKRQHDLQEARAQREQELKELQPFKIGTDPNTLTDVYGVRDPKSKKIITLDPRTGQPMGTPIDPGSLDQSSLTGEDFLKTIPPNQAEMLRKVNAGEIPPTSFPPKRRELIMRQVAQAFPGPAGFDATIWKTRNETRAAFAKGVEGRAVGSLDTLSGHLNDFMDTATKLSQRNVKPWNRIENALKDNFGQTAVADYRTARTAVADELARVFQGAGVAAESEKQRWLDALDEARTPAQMKAVIRRLTSLTESRMRTLEYQHDRGMNYDPEHPLSRVTKGFMNPEARTKFEAVKKWANEPDPEPRRRGAAPAPVPAQPAAKIAPAERFKQLVGSGKKEEEAYSIMKQEGY